MSERIDINKILASEQPSVGTVLFIAIDGHGGSGKSSLAKLLSAKLNAQIVHTDDFASWDNPLNWWPLIIERVFEPIKNGLKTLNYPRSKWSADHNPEPVIDQPVTPIMILEGVSSLRREFRDYISLSIFVDTPKDICLKRGIGRDLSINNKPREELLQMWDKWIEDEDDYIARDKPQDYADVVIDGVRPFEEQIK